MRAKHQLQIKPLCALCEEQGRVVPATIADHHPTHKGDYNAFVLGPLRSLRVPMKIVILSHSDVASTIGAALWDRGHEVTWFGGGAVHKRLLDSLNDHDGCLLLGEEPELAEFARQFRERGKMVWREWTDISPTKEWPHGGFLASSINLADRAETRPERIPSRRWRR
jgi:hypothetical protein